MMLANNESGSMEDLAKELQYSPKLLAERTGLSIRQLERRFKKYYGRTARDWMLSCRMQAAVAYLAEKQKIAYISHQLAYQQPSHFCHEFKKFFGVTPSHYR